MLRQGSVFVLLVAAGFACSDDEEPGRLLTTLDLAAATEGVERIYGSVSTGRFGVPVASGHDVDGDGRMDLAMSAMLASPDGRIEAGQVFLVFGNGQIGGTHDTGQADPTILPIYGVGRRESTGIEVWMDDVTGDGLGDIIVGRSNMSREDRIGAGGVSIVVGGAALKTLAAQDEVLDLAALPTDVRVLTIVGAQALDRLGFWNRTGDATGDGVADLLISADQRDRGDETNAGAAYLVRGGAHLNQTLTVDLAEFGATALSGHVARFDPPASAADYHFGATLELIDLDADGRAEALISASLSRVGGMLEADGAPAGSGARNGGNAGGSLFIYWADNVPGGATWPPGLTIGFDETTGSVSRIDGGTIGNTLTSVRFGEELVGGLDYDADGRADLFVGDIRGTARNLRDAGLGHVFFDAATLKGQRFGLGAIPNDVRVTHVLGPEANAISSDTALHGDIDGDGIADLVTASPLADPNGRRDAGVIHVLWGQPGPWPTVLDLADRAPEDRFITTDILGARGAGSPEDFGDILMYSAVGADVDGDGRTDLVVNEMTGNGVERGTVDVGNLIVISGRIVPKP